MLGKALPSFNAYFFGIGLITCTHPFIFGRVTSSSSPFSISPSTHTSLFGFLEKNAFTFLCCSRKSLSGYDYFCGVTLLSLPASFSFLFRRKYDFSIIQSLVSGQLLTFLYFNFNSVSLLSCQLFSFSDRKFNF